MSYKKLHEERTSRALQDLGYKKPEAEKYAKLYVKELFS